MTFGFKTMLEIEGSIQYRFSVGGVTARHTPGPAGRIRALFNGSWRRLREIVSLASDGSYLEGTAPAALPTTAAVTGEVYAEIPWPLGAVGVYGVRVQTATGGRWRNLRRIPFTAYQDFQEDNLLYSLPPMRGPIGYTSRLLPDGVGSVETVGQVMITPIPTGGLYRLWTLSAFASRTADTDTFNGFSDFFLWAELDTCIQMLSPDADSQGVYSMWSAERKAARDLIETRAARLEAGDAQEPRDARGDGYDYGDWRGSL
jgi:hypothetical protein